MIWRSLVVQARDYASGKGGVLSAVSTEWALGWFERLSTRPNWARRHQLTTISSMLSDAADEMTLVRRLLKDSDSHMVQERREAEQSQQARDRPGQSQSSRNDERECARGANRQEQQPMSVAESSGE